MLKTYGSEEARLKLRDILDDVGSGQESVIERYNKPVAVVVGYRQWQALKRLRAEQIAQSRAEAKAGETYSFEQVETMLKQDGLLP
jgi:prevent-host-death family protein